MITPRTHGMAAFALLVFPHGGQRAARRNARTAMAVTQARADAGREATAALTALPRDAHVVPQDPRML